MLWDVDEHATLFIEHGPVETNSNGVRHVSIPDPDGNSLAFAESPG